MAEIIEGDKGHKGGGKKRAKKHSTHIDMTPMVDLACLLITFFMLTTAFSKPKVMEIVLPEKNTDTANKKNKGVQIPKSRTINILISGDNKVYWYRGMMEKEPYPPLLKTDYSKDGIRKVLLESNKDLFTQIEDIRKKALEGKIKDDPDFKYFDDSVKRETQKAIEAKAKIREYKPQDFVNFKIKRLNKLDDKGPIVLIKADENAKYGNIVDIIDEMAITCISRYAIVDLTPVEKKFLKEAK